MSGIAIHTVALALRSSNARSMNAANGPARHGRVVQTAVKIVLEPIFEAVFRGQRVWLSTSPQSGRCIEDGLSVFEETGLGVWAAGSAGNMPKIAAALPSYVECITIFTHRDETGLRFAKEAARLIAAMGVEVHIKGRG